MRPEDIDKAIAELQEAKGKPDAKSEGYLDWLISELRGAKEELDARTKGSGKESETSSQPDERRD